MNDITYVSLDFFNATTNKAIEFFGDYWHANPKIYDKSFKNLNNGMSGEEIWKRDQNRLKSIEEKYGIEVKVIWELDQHNQSIIDELTKWVFEK